MNSNSSLQRSLEIIAVVAWIVAFFALVIGVASLINGCSSGTISYPRHELLDQILRPRPGHEGKLTNTSLDATGAVHTDEYDINDEPTRAKLNTLNFVCNIGGRHFKVCKDKAGFCRFSTTKSCFLFFCKDSDKQEEFIPVYGYQFLLDAKTRCFNKETYPFGGIQ